MKCKIHLDIDAVVQCQLSKLYFCEKCTSSIILREDFKLQHFQRIQYIAPNHGGRKNSSPSPPDPPSPSCKE